MNKEVKLLIKELELTTEIPELKSKEDWIKAQIQYCMEKCNISHECLTGKTSEEYIDITTGEIQWLHDVQVIEIKCPWEEEKCRLSQRMS